MYRGIERARFTLTMAACNLAGLPNCSSPETEGGYPAASLHTGPHRALRKGRRSAQQSCSAVCERPQERRDTLLRAARMAKKVWAQAEQEAVLYPVSQEVRFRKTSGRVSTSIYISKSAKPHRAPASQNVT